MKRATIEPVCDPSFASIAWCSFQVRLHFCPHPCLLFVLACPLIAHAAALVATGNWCHGVNGCISGTHNRCKTLIVQSSTRLACCAVRSCMQHGRRRGSTHLALAESQSLLANRIAICPRQRHTRSAVCQVVLMQLRLRSRTDSCLVVR